MFPFFFLVLFISGYDVSTVISVSTDVIHFQECQYLLRKHWSEVEKTDDIAWLCLKVLLNPYKLHYVIKSSVCLGH